jgi:hypothetical protein
MEVILLAVVVAVVSQDELGIINWSQAETVTVMGEASPKQQSDCFFYGRSRCGI